jgi:uncharacterized protein YeeX (DUF496 family)
MNTRIKTAHEQLLELRNLKQFIKPDSEIKGIRTGIIPPLEEVKEEKEEKELVPIVIETLNNLNLK